MIFPQFAETCAFDEFTYLARVFDNEFLDNVYLFNNINATETDKNFHPLVDSKMILL